MSVLSGAVDVTRFAAPSSERGFLEHLSPQIAAWTVVYHCVTSALLFIAALWMVYIEERGGQMSPSFVGHSNQVEPSWMADGTIYV